MTKKTALVINPGRGVYNAPELGYLGRHHAERSAMIGKFDNIRNALSQKTISELDGAERYSLSAFSRGDNASGLIYTCSYADFMAIDRGSFDIVAVTGNSMGWYTALACAGAVSDVDGFRIVNTMGEIMQNSLIGGQIIYPFVDDNWQTDEKLRNRLTALIKETPNLYLSIELGGMVVFAGDEAALSAVESALPQQQNRFPMRLGNHAGFHSPMQEANARRGQSALPVTLFQQPKLPLIDGRGHIWWPKASNLDALWAYTFGHQVTEPYDFTRAVQTGLKEFAPDVVIVLGPGTTLGGAVAQSMIAADWAGLHTKADFIALQKTNPILLAMGMDEQRKPVIGH